MERTGRAAVFATAASVTAVPGKHINTGSSMHCQIPKLRGRENVGVFLRPFRTWACSNRCYAVLESDTAINAYETRRADFEELHANLLLSESFLT